MEKKQIDQRTSTAYHEAGHALIAHLHGVPFLSVSIVKEADSLGRLLGAKWRSRFRPDAEIGRREERRIDALVRTLLAGKIAEGILAGKRSLRGSENDTAVAFTLAGYVCASDDEMSAFIELARIRTRNELTLDWNWAAAGALATELLKNQSLSARRAKQILGEAIESNGE